MQEGAGAGAGAEHKGAGTEHKGEGPLEHLAVTRKSNPHITALHSVQGLASSNIGYN